MDAFGRGISIYTDTDRYVLQQMHPDMHCIALHGTAIQCNVRLRIAHRSRKAAHRLLL